MHELSKVLSSALAVLAFLAVPARGQIILPGKKSAEKGNVAPHYVCLTCGARNYELHDESRRDEQGNVVGWCSTCKHDRSQKFPGAVTGLAGSKSGRDGRLVLPPALPATRAAPPAQKVKPPASASKPGPSPVPNSTGRAGPADFIFIEVRKHKRFDDSLAARAVESLLALGEDGLAASRRNLHTDEAPVLMTAARVLLRSGRPEDADLVCERMRERLPIAAGAPLLDLLAGADPVRASPAFLAELLDHPHVGVRIEAQRRLLRLLTPEAASTPTESEADEGDRRGVDLVPVLEPALFSKRADTRQRAADVLARVDSPASTRLLLDHVADPAANVVASVADALAWRADPDLDAKLLGLAFRERWVLRTGACSLLALVEREDRTLRPILDESHVEPMLSGLQSGDPFLAGACAVGLAGIGFRSRNAAATTWLDQEVVDRLITSVSGQRFHSDLPALTGPSLRRLGLLTGQSIGSDGPRWLEWWMQSREGFFARRAWLEVRPEDVPRLSIRYEQGGTERLAFTLLGPENESSIDRGGFAGGEETVRLDSAQARDLVLAFEREGVFGPEKLPGLRGLRGGGERTLQVLLASRGKSFIFGSGESEPWFDRTVALVRDLLDRNRWQRYPDPARHLSPHELWLEQSAWWAEEHTDAERALRMKTLVLAALPMRVDAGRDEGIAELERAYGHGGRGGQGRQGDPEGRAGVAEPDDFAPLTRLLGSEAFWTERAHRLLGLCLLAAAAPRAIGEEAAAVAAPPDATRHLPPDRGRVLVDLLMERFPNAPPDELARIFSACGDAFADTMSSDARAAVRVAAARNLLDRRSDATDESDATEEEDASPAGELSPTAVATLLRLLGDPEASVEAAAVEALGHHRVEAARTELLVRARLGLPEVRAAALRAIGRLRGELVLDALSLAATDRDPSIRLAAAWGLCDLADPASVPLLIEILGDGEGTPAAEAARAGLAALGPAAHEPLLRLVHSPNHRGRREAALLLSRQAVPEAASALIAMLSTSPRDEHIASELCVLTAVDLRADPDPAAAWWGWWDGVVHDDATAWFLAALSRAGGSPPASSDLEGAGTREGRLSMLEVLARREAHFVERARRELSRMLGRDLGSLPPRGEGRDVWIASLGESITGPEAR